jgi:hypothetical protein
MILAAISGIAKSRFCYNRNPGEVGFIMEGCRVAWRRDSLRLLP